MGIHITHPTTTTTTTGGSSSSSGPSAQSIQNATDSYLNMLSQWGIPLTQKARSLVQQAVAGQWGASTFLQHLRGTSMYAQAFPGIMNPDGTLKMSEAQYLATKQSMVAAANALGFNVSDKLVGLAFKNNLSVAEFTARYQAERLIKDNPEYMQQMHIALKERGVNFNSHTDLAKFLLGESPKQFYNAWQEASSAGAAEMAGLSVQHPLFKGGNGHGGNGGSGGQGSNGTGQNFKPGNRAGVNTQVAVAPTTAQGIQQRPTGEPGGNVPGPGGNGTGGQGTGGTGGGKIPSGDAYGVGSDAAGISRHYLKQVSKYGLSPQQLAAGFKQLADLMTANLPEAMAMQSGVTRKDFQQSIFGGKGSADARANVQNFLANVDAYYNEQRATGGIQQGNIVSQNPGNAGQGQTQ